MMNVLPLPKLLVQDSWHGTNLQNWGYFALAAASLSGTLR